MSLVCRLKKKKPFLGIFFPKVYYFFSPTLPVFYIFFFGLCCWQDPFPYFCLILSDSRQDHSPQEEKLLKFVQKPIMDT